MMELLEKARDTKRIVSRLSESEKNQGLLAMAQSLERYAQIFWQPMPWIWRRPMAASPPSCWTG